MILVQFARVIVSTHGWHGRSVLRGGTENGYKVAYPLLHK